MKLTKEEEVTAQAMLYIALARLDEFEANNDVKLSKDEREGIADYICSYCPPFDSWWEDPTVADDDVIRSIVNQYRKAD